LTEYKKIKRFLNFIASVGPCMCVTEHKKSPVNKGARRRCDVPDRSAPGHGLDAGSGKQEHTPAGSRMRQAPGSQKQRPKCCTDEM
jgi:hypothetical protein